jgi:rhodanese-related sulfurtransferase
MPKDLHRNEVRALLAQGAQLVDVMPRKEFREEHLPGAVNIPLAKLDREAPKRLRRDRPVIVYCYDYQ